MTTIDELVVTLALDASKFTTEQKKAVQQLKKLEQEQQKNNKESQKSWNDAANAITKAKNQLIAFGTAAIGVNGFKDFVATMVSGNAALGRTSHLLDMSVRDLDAWGGAARRFGGDAKSVQSSIQGIEGHLAARFTSDQSGFLTTLAQLGANDAVDWQKNTVDLYKLADAIKRVKDTRGEQVAYNLAQQLGLDQGTFMMLMQGGDAVKKLHDHYYDLSRASDDNVDASTRLLGKWSDLKAEAEALGQSVFSDLVPALDAAADAATKALQSTDKATGADLIKNGNWWDASFKLSLTDFVGALAMKEAGKSDAEIAAALSKKPISNGAMTDADMAADYAAGGMPVSLSSGSPSHLNDVVSFFEKQGWSHAQALGIAANIEAESKGNAQASGDNGAAYGLGQWHPDRQAQFAKLFGHDIRNSTMDEQLKFYQWELKNSQAKTGQDLSGATSAGQAAAIVSSEFERPADREGEMKRRAMLATQYAAMVGPGATAKASGAGQTTVETSINTINVNTQATDANGIAKDMNKALQDNALISAGLMGAM
jgi:hypothetical protein